MNCETIRIVRMGLAICLWLMIDGSDSWGAESAKDFYRGKTISWIVSSEPGSPTDLIARTIAPYMSKEFGARVRVEDMKTDEGINYVYKQGTRDGLTLGSKTTDAIIGNDILKAPGVLYETDKLNFIADVAPSTKVFQLSPKLPYKAIVELKKAKGLRGGGTSAKGSLAVSSAVILEVLELDGKVITGYQGKKNLTLALGRGEIDFMVTNDHGSEMDEKDGYAINFAIIGDKRSASIPHVPTLSEMGVKIPKDLQSGYKFIASGGTSVFLPPGVPSERVEHLVKSFYSLSKNNDLQTALEKLTGIRTPFIPGHELQREMAEIKADKSLATKLDAIFKKYSAVR